ncbi:Small-conductance mechanosensitive channel [Sulfitobacter marinus]|uniref:Small-conductance mechanosensitive channel n=1 Tax=Sulfitobacter marinus TaxID=394264 RepID=A0A1I6UH66_9RHOB|nr:mechanosensitive ion channel family protein [Sulfitobacter marinus]SFT00829.1 Small-conductance mechanosensitive channel [Sulfitobacter marinus]
MKYLALFLCLSLPLSVAAQNNTVHPTGAITVEESAAGDRAIAKRIREIIAELDGYDGVDVAVSAGIVTLTGTTVDAQAAKQLTDLVGRIEGIVAIENETSETTDVTQRLNPALDRFRARMAQTVSFLPLAGVALAIFLLVVVLGFFIARWQQPWDRLAPNAFIADIYRQVIRLVFIIAALVLALDIVGATALLSGILGAAGIAGLAIGFAVRDTVENFIASIMLSVRQPFRPNDTVEIEGDTGKVIRLTSRATILLSFDGNHIRIPNSTVFKARIVNFTRNAERRFAFELGMAPDTDFAAARQLGLETLLVLPFVLKTPEPSVWIETVGDSTISLQFTAWVDQTDTSINLARGEAIRQMITAFEHAGYAMPEPTYRVVNPVQATADEPEPKTQRVSTTPAPTAPQDVEANAEKALEQIVDQERAGTEDDLLTEEAANE